MTRATMALLRGDVAQAYQFHPVAIVLVPLLGVYAVASAVSYIRHGRSRVDQVLSSLPVTVGLVLLLVLLIVVWIARFFGAFGGPVPV